MVFNRLLKAAGLKSNELNLVIIDDNTINAWVNSNGTVGLNLGMLKFNAKFPEHTVSVLAHEISHYTEGHVGLFGWACNVSDSASRMCEKEADLVGQELMKKAGYDSCEAGGIWIRFILKYGNLGGHTHPKFMDRFEYLKCDEK